MYIIQFFSLTDFGNSYYQTTGTHVVSGASTMDINDDNFNFDGRDEFGFTDPSLDQETNGAAISVWNGGQAVVTNNTTGETGTLVYVAENDEEADEQTIIGYSSDIQLSAGNSITIQDYRPVGGSIPYANLAPAAAPCFTSGTLIETINGDVAIEDLQEGDMVKTLDSGFQPIRWIGSTKRAAVGDLAPILIRKGALGNKRDLMVSPQHRMLLEGWRVELMFGEDEVLASAKSLINDHSITRQVGGVVQYFHMLFDTHQVIFAEGAPSESFHPGEDVMNALDEATRNEILELFPQLEVEGYASYGPAACLSLKDHEGQLMSQYI